MVIIIVIIFSNKEEGITLAATYMNLENMLHERTQSQNTYRVKKKVHDCHWKGREVEEYAGTTNGHRVLFRVMKIF